MFPQKKTCFHRFFLQVSPDCSDVHAWLRSDEPGLEVDIDIDIDIPPIFNFIQP